MLLLGTERKERIALKEMPALKWGWSSCRLRCTFGGLGPNAKEALSTIAKDLRKMKGEEDEDE